MLLLMNFYSSQIVIFQTRYKIPIHLWSTQSSDRNSDPRQHFELGLIMDRTKD
jgi:hypothetical protein